VPVARYPRNYALCVQLSDSALVEDLAQSSTCLRKLIFFISIYRGLEFMNDGLYGVRCRFLKDLLKLIHWNRKARLIQPRGIILVYFKTMQMVKRDLDGL